MDKISVSNPSQIQVYENDYEYRLEIVSETTEFRRTGIHLPWLSVISIICAVVAVSIFLRFFKTPGGDSKSNEDTNAAPNVITRAEQKSLAQQIHSAGIVFPDSDSRLLNNKDIDNLWDTEGFTAKELLRLAVNEIYARNHYLFKTEYYKIFYTRYDWYSGYLEEAEVSKAFNEYERENIEFLVAIEKQHGFS